ncbi:hypothetical protein [Schinkia azotoformans]|uniref:hypothetical protein n=1 Tax=Schinkia azotoformans TaxID=1454 RepID=UPI002DB84084|nr:hypothetical protein [Schinkia azotoformans]MEC1717551.1 hypothetical protein [Schinkia azotoformans]MEC1742499.1 hypothetical protein [Schinkia azotoformans]MEC1747928.1 hypothetical protein [Schinkia azotoformans]MEC1759319.1 hypothetical protein [Schinkia azotoformans]MEC1767722.1 hypothetical protein [Schinkia azotoformans]
MKIIRFWFAILFILFLFACNNSAYYEDQDVVAIVLENEITYKDVRSLNNVEGKYLRDIVEHYIIQELVIHEATELGIIVKDEDVSQVSTLFPIEEINKENQQFIENQANSLGMTIEEYYQFYIIEISKRQEYMNRLLEFKFGDSIDSEKVNSYFEELLIKYKDDIEIKL